MCTRIGFLPAITCFSRTAVETAKNLFWQFLSVFDSENAKNCHSLCSILQKLQMSWNNQSRNVERNFSCEIINKSRNYTQFEEKINTLQTKLNVTWTDFNPQQWTWWNKLFKIGSHTYLNVQDLNPFNLPVS